MSFACPYCKAALNPKGLKPGKYQPKCPKCQKAFVITVLADEAGKLSARVSAATSAVAPEVAKPVAKKAVDPEELAAQMLASDVGAATGDFTEAEEPPPQTRAEESACEACRSPGHWRFHPGRGQQRRPSRRRLHRCRREFRCRGEAEAEEDQAQDRTFRRTPRRRHPRKARRLRGAQSARQGRHGSRTARPANLARS